MTPEKTKHESKRIKNNYEKKTKKEKKYEKKKLKNNSEINKK
jgi:hypothetical protein